MNNNGMLAIRQSNVAGTKEKLGCDLQQAICVVNAEYQQIDMEDLLFLNATLYAVLSFLENNEETYAIS